MKKEKEKPFETALSKSYGNPIIGSVLHNINFFSKSKNFESKFIFQKNEVFFIECTDQHASCYLNDKTSYSEEEWKFFFQTLAIILSFKLYVQIENEYTENQAIQEKAFISFAVHYVYEVLGNKNLPTIFENYLFLKDEISHKNENHVYEKFLENKNNQKISDKFFNFSTINRRCIFFKKTNLYYYQSKEDFQSIFIKALKLNAQKTIALRAKKNVTEAELKVKDSNIYKAHQWFITKYPLMASLAASFEVVEDLSICKLYNIHIAAVFPTQQKIVINPLANLNIEGLKFVIAHEILHIALGHATRRLDRDRLLWNLACDFVINQWLIEMNIGKPPESIFYDKSLSDKSAEEIYFLIAENKKIRDSMCTLRNKNAGNSFKDKNSTNSFNKKNDQFCDIMDFDVKYFSDFEDACKEKLFNGLDLHRSIGRGLIPASLEEEIKVLNQKPIPWQAKLADWFAEKFPLEESKRSYSRASRRQSSTPDIPRPAYVKPEYDKKTRTFGVILDTSGSMDLNLLGKCIGSIIAYASAQEVKYVRIIYCDAQPYDEGFVEISTLIHKVKVKGRGGTELQPAVDLLINSKDFPENAPILILTDGFIEDSLTVLREHAFLLPKKNMLPFYTQAPIFEFS